MTEVLASTVAWMLEGLALAALVIAADIAVRHWHR